MILESESVWRTRSTLESFLVGRVTSYGIVNEEEMGGQ